MAKLKEKKEAYAARRSAPEAGAIANAKASALQTLERLPGDVAYEDIMYELYVLQKIEHGYDDMRDKKTISHKDAGKRLDRWLK